jgi:hypothetical protein
MEAGSVEERDCQPPCPFHAFYTAHRKSEWGSEHFWNFLICYFLYYVIWLKGGIPKRRKACFTLDELVLIVWSRFSKKWRNRKPDLCTWIKQVHIGCKNCSFPFELFWHDAADMPARSSFGNFWHWILKVAVRSNVKVFFSDSYSISGRFDLSVRKI